jgi:VWFA-related protein
MCPIPRLYQQAPREGLVTVLRIHPALALTLLCSAAAAQTPAQPPQQQPPIQIQVPLQPRPDDQIVTLHANARAVLLDVVVTDGHGHPVHGLKPQDFHIEEDGKPQTVASLEEHHPLTPEELAKQPKLRDLGPNTFTNRKPPPTEGASTVFLLDALDSSPQAQIYARDQLLHWIDDEIKDLPPGAHSLGNQVAIFQLDTQLHQIQGFTTDPAELKTAIKERYKPVLNPIAGARNNYAVAAVQMDVLTHAMQQIGAYLQTRPGRKNLVWFTAHIPRYSYDDGTYVGGALHDSQSFLFDYSKATDALVLGEVSVYPIDTRGLQVDPAYSAASGRAPSAGSAGAFSTRQFFEHNDLDQVAEATGGHAFYNTNGIKQAVAEVIDTGSSYYTLSYYPTNKKWDGSYRNLKLELPGGVQPEYRHGYYAQASEGPRPEPAANSAAAGRVQITHHDVVSPDEAAFNRSMHLGAVQLNQIVFAAHIEVDPAVQKLAKNQPLPNGNYLEQKYRDKPFRTYKVLYVVPGAQIEMDPQNGGQPGGTHKGSLELTTLVIDDKDNLVNSNSLTLNMNLKDDNYQLMVAKGLDVPLTIAVPEKGSYFLRVGVHDKISGKSGTLELSTGNVKIGPLGP